MKSIYIYGASGHGLVVADIAFLCGYDNIVFIDDADNKYPSFEDIKNNIDIPIAFGIGSNHIRAKLFKKVFDYGLKIATLIHPSALISDSVKIGMGSVVMANVVINANASIGKCVILNTSSVIEHENIIQDYVHISPCVALAGKVTISEGVHIGINSTLVQGVSVGKNSIVGAGSVVVNNIDDNKVAYGNPCREIRKVDE